MMKIRLLTVAALMAAVVSQAAIITFSDRSVVTDENDVLVNGTKIVAGNVYGGGTDPVLNGVTFQQFWFDLPISGNGVNMSLHDLSATTGYTFTDAATYYAADPDLAELMSKSTLGAYYAPGCAITMSNLTVGAEYQLQGFYWDKASGSIQYIRNADNYDNRSPTFNTSASAIGYSWTATWVADSTTQSIEVMNGPSSRTLLTGVSLIQVPEPASVGLLGIGLFGILGLRRFYS